MNNNTTNRINAATPTDKTPEQRQDELELVTADISIPDSIKANAKKLDAKDLKIGNIVLRNLGECYARAWQAKTGKRAGETSYTLFDNRYEPIVLKGKDNTKIYIRVSIVTF